MGENQNKEKIQKTRKNKLDKYRYWYKNKRNWFDIILFVIFYITLLYAIGISNEYNKLSRRLNLGSKWKKKKEKKKKLN